MNRRNYQRELEQLIEENKSLKKAPTLLLHSCCAPCSSYVLEYLSQVFQITVYYYNPNIDPPLEYDKRAGEQENLIGKMKTVHPVKFVKGRYEPDQFYQTVKGLENEKEGGKRCERCYELRLTEAAKVALAGKYDYFTTTLSISPLKDADKLNRIGERVGEEYGVRFLPSDFKKRDGYMRSVRLSEEYGLYRQDYCGCVFSRNREKSDEQERLSLDRAHGL